jgi:hypothetical protein
MKTFEQYDALTVADLQKEIVDREIPEATSGLKKADLIELLMKHDGAQASGKFVVPTYEAFAKAYPEATREMYGKRFFGFKAGELASDAEIEQRLKESQAATREQAPSEKPVSVSRDDVELANTCNASEKVVSAVRAFLLKRQNEAKEAAVKAKRSFVLESYDIITAGKSQVVVHGSICGAMKIDA